MGAAGVGLAAETPLVVVAKTSPGAGPVGCPMPQPTNKRMSSTEKLSMLARCLMKSIHPSIRETTKARWQYSTSAVFRLSFRDGYNRKRLFWFSFEKVEHHGPL
jgi:hypothetical protein